MVVMRKGGKQAVSKDIRNFVLAPFFHHRDRFVARFVASGPTAPEPFFGSVTSSLDHV